MDHAEGQPRAPARPLQTGQSSHKGPQATQGPWELPTKNNPAASCALERARAHSQEMENNLQLQQKMCAARMRSQQGKQ